MEEPRTELHWHAIAAVLVSVAGLEARTGSVKLEAMSAGILTAFTSDSVGTVVHTLPKGSELLGGFTLSAIGNAGNAATLDFALNRGTGAIEAVFRSVASANGRASGSADSGPGPATIKFHLSSAVQIKVIVTVVMSTSMTPLGAGGWQNFASPTLGTLVHFTSQGPGASQTYRTVLGPNGLDILLSNNFTASTAPRFGVSSAEGTLRCSIVPDPNCPWGMAGYGTSCGATLTFAGLFQPAGTTEVFLVDSWAPAQAWICFGAARRTIPILGCVAHNDWTVAVPVTLVRPNVGSMLLAPPPSFGIVLEAQAVTWNSGTLHTSAGIELIPAKL